WGQRIPVWYGPDGEVVASKESPGPGFEQDPDVFDTWFSSGLWPIATLGWPDEDTEDLRYFYPTDLLSTAREIMYLWVARMIMMGLHFEGEIPFQKVNVHSIVLAEDGTKMSRSKGNTIDPLELLDEYGTDAVRFGLLYQSSTQDFPYSRERAEMGRAFVTKLWNAMRFVLSYPEPEEEGELSPSDRWILSEFDRTVREYDAYLEECEFSEAMRRIYSFAWNQFADWYIEIAKAAPSSGTPRILREVFHGILKLLHPVMPFATEEMASVMGEHALLAMQSFPEPDPARRDEEADRMLDRTRRAVSAVRSFRAEAKVDGQLEGPVPQGVDEGVFAALAGVSPAPTGNGAGRASLPAGDVVVEILLSEEMRRGEIERLRREISRAEQEVARSQSKLANDKFVDNAPEKIVAGEREKLDV
ncbi:MAG TPA: class I tRNA ligase family protein, partial [Rubrobacter sp.]|nr:class I tRNA ligase family protein [Rubrobacter sp.]